MSHLSKILQITRKSSKVKDSPVQNKGPSKTHGYASHYDQEKSCEYFAKDVLLQTFAALCNITAFENVAIGEALMDMQAVFVKFVPTIYAKLVAEY